MTDRELFLKVIFTSSATRLTKSAEEHTKVPMAILEAHIWKIPHVSGGLWETPETT
jgi:hypothetical protein